MAKRGRPKGSVGTGKWGKHLILMASEALELGHPIIPLVPDGSPKRMKLGLVKAATPLVRAGKLLRFKLWYPNKDAPNRRWRTYICLPEARWPDGSLIYDEAFDLLSGVHPIIHEE